MIDLILGDCREVLARMPDQAVDAVITDPPYGVDAADWDAECPYALLPELLRVSRGLVLWFGASPRMAVDLASFPIPPQRVLIWHVTFSLAATAAHGIYYRYHPLYAWQLPKSQRGIDRDVIDAPQDGRNGWYHRGTKPLGLMRRLVRMAEEGALLLDPFLGSGTTAVAAYLEHRDAIGIERDPASMDIARRRIAGVEMQPSLFDVPLARQAQLIAEA